MGMAANPARADQLFVGDTVRYVVYSVNTTTGAVATVAGGQCLTPACSAAGYADGVGLAALFNTPAGMQVDGAGRLFVADQNNGRVRVVAAATGVVSTLAGGGPTGTSGTSNLAAFGALAGPASTASLTSVRGMYLASANALFVTTFFPGPTTYLPAVVQRVTFGQGADDDDGLPGGGATQPNGAGATVAFVAGGGCAAVAAGCV